MSDLKNKKSSLANRRKSFSYLLPLASLRLTIILLSLSMVLVFVATLEQVRIGIRGALAEYFESFYGIWYYPKDFWGGNFLSEFPLPIPGGYLLGGLLIFNLSARTSSVFNGPQKKPAFNLFILVLFFSSLDNSSPKPFRRNQECR